MPSSGDPINTGPGGFAIDGQLYTFDVGVADADGGSQGAYVPGVDVSAALVDSTGAPKDLSTPTLVTLGQYLSNVTMGLEGSTPVANRYPVDNTVKKPTTLVDPHGYPAPLESPVNNADTFTGGDETVIAYSTSEYPTIASLIKKGLSSNNTIDGHDLLAGIPGTVNLTAMPNQLAGANAVNPKPITGHPLTDNVVTPYVSAVLLNNRFASAGTNQQNPYANFDIANPVPSYNPALATQGILGDYDPGSPTVTMGRLASIGGLLTLRAAGTVGATAPGADPNSLALQASALLPGTAQLGVTQINNQVLLASDILSTLTTDEVPDANVLSIGGQSWGVLNTTEDPFSGTDALGMLGLSVALVAGLVVVIDALSALMSAVTPGTKMPTHDPQGRYAVGQYYNGTKAGQQQAAGGLGGAVNAIANLNFGALLGIQPTFFPLATAMQTGLNAFFGLPQNGGILGQLAGAAVSSADSPGFNVVVARAIIRSSITVTNALKGVGGNPINAANAVLSLVDTIRSSKVVAAINIFGMLGDAILTQPTEYVDSSATGQIKVSQLDNQSDALVNAVSKSRLKGTLKLAWASNTAPANMLLPASILGASAIVNGLGQFQPYLGVQQDPYSQVQATVLTKDNAGRIDPATAQEFEAMLDAEYVPFYFHDLRTNEMVSFHAFLSALTDDFTAGYEKSDGFGRVEPVKIYKSTERRIGMSFYIAATSLLDLDEMYVKINKLVTLIYPQYTQGLTLLSTDKTYSVTQPFSQLVGASPMIRIRLGDLLRSNYSQFALARLFGLGNQAFTVNGQQLTTDSQFDQSTLDALANDLAQAKQCPNSETYVPSDGNYPLYVDTGNTIGAALSAIPVPSVPGITGKQGPQNAPTFQPQLIAAAGSIIVATALYQHPQDANTLICQINYNTDPTVQETYASQLAQADYAFNNPNFPLQRVIGGKYAIPAYALKPTQATIQSFITKLVNSNSSFAQELSNFMNPNGGSSGYNAVAKSFADTGGKGLAGFIETMSFDWLNQTTWETSLGMVAPKLCKVTLTFSPVHDISPGLDHLGFNRSPVYPVGVMGQTSQTNST